MRSRTHLPRRREARLQRVRLEHQRVPLLPKQLRGAFSTYSYDRIRVCISSCARTCSSPVTLVALTGRGFTAFPAAQYEPREDRLAPPPSLTTAPTHRGTANPPPTHPATGTVHTTGSVRVGGGGGGTGAHSAAHTWPRAPRRGAPCTDMRSSPVSGSPVTGHFPSAAMAASISRRSNRWPPFRVTTGSDGTSPETARRARPSAAAEARARGAPQYTRPRRPPTCAARRAPPRRARARTRAPRTRAEQRAHDRRRGGRMAGVT